MDTLYFILLVLSGVGFIASLIFAGKNRLKAGGIFLALSILFFILLGSTGTPATPQTNPPKTETPSTPQKISFDIIKQWDEKEAGKGKLIAINSADATEASMKLLGAELENEYRADKGNVIILVYTDAKAAKQRDSLVKGMSVDLIDTYRLGLFSTVDEGANLTPPDDAKNPSAAYDKAFVGLYRKGELYGDKNQWIIQLGGVWDKNKIVVTY